MVLKIKAWLGLRHIHVAELNLLMGSQSLLDNWISNGNTARYKQSTKEPEYIRFPSKRSHTTTNMNNNINMDSTVTG